MKITDVTRLDEGEWGEVVEIAGGCGVTRRLDSMGIRIGTKLRRVSSQLMRGPVTLRLNGFQVAIGFGMARKILVKREDKAD
jgi:ferrous iron transport protein A